MSRKRIDRTPVVAAALTSLFTAACIVVARPIVAKVGALPIGFYRYGTGALVVSTLLKVMSTPGMNLLKVPLKDIMPLAIWGTTAYCLVPMSYGAALARIPASLASVLFATAPLWGAALSLVTGKHKLSARQWVGIMATLGGTALLTLRSQSGEAGDGALYGKAVMLLAAFLLALSGIGSKPLLMRHRALTVAALQMVFGAMASLIFGIARHGFFLRELASMSGTGLLQLAFLGFCGGALDAICWFYALSKLRPAQVFVFLNLSPVLASLMGFIFLSEVISPIFIVASAIILSGVMVTQLARK